MEFNCFVLYRIFYRLYQQEDDRQVVSWEIFYRLYQQEDDRQVVSREIFPGCQGCRQELFQYYFWQYVTLQLLGEKVGNMDYFFPARRAVVRTHKYICVFMYS